MPASKIATHRSFATAGIKSDLARLDAHEITPEEYAEIPELTDEMVARAQFYVGGKPVASSPVLEPETTEAVSIRLSPAVLAHFRAGGPGWQTPINEILLDAVRREDATAKG